jgi:hypothetical protein
VEDREGLRAGLAEIAAAEGWHPPMAAALGDVALRRWLSFERRQPRRTREQDLLRGLKEQFGDDLYLEPGSLERVSERFAGYLAEIEQGTDLTAARDEEIMPTEAGGQR